MARDVNVYTGQWTNTGLTTAVPRWTFTTRFEWVDDAGVPHTDERTYTFPNALATVPARRLKEYMEYIIMAEARIGRGIDRDPDA